MIQDLRNPSSIFCILLAVKTFSHAESLKKWWLVEDEVNMVDKARLGSPTYSPRAGRAMCDWKLWRKIGPSLLTNAGCGAMQFSVDLIDLLSTLLGCNFQWHRKAEVDQKGRGHQRVPNTIICFTFGFEKGFEALSLGSSTELSQLL